MATGNFSGRKQVKNGEGETRQRETLIGRALLMDRAEGLAAFGM